MMDNRRGRLRRRRMMMMMMVVVTAKVARVIARVVTG